MSATESDTARGRNVLETILDPVAAMINDRIGAKTPARELCETLDGRVFAIRVRDSGLAAYCFVHPGGIMLSAIGEMLFSALVPGRTRCHCHRFAAFARGTRRRTHRGTRQGRIDRLLRRRAACARLSQVAPICEAGFRGIPLWRRQRRSRSRHRRICSWRRRVGAGCADDHAPEHRRIPAGREPQRAGPL